MGERRKNELSAGQQKSRVIGTRRGSAHRGRKQDGDRRQKQHPRSGEQQEAPPEPAKPTTYSKLDMLRKHSVIILLYLFTLFLVVLISVLVTLFLTREKEPDVLDVSDLNIEYVDPATVEDGSFW